MALCAALLLLRRPQAVEWPHHKVMQRLLVLVITLVLYAWGFEWLGFPLATALLTFSIGLLFQASLRQRPSPASSWAPRCTTPLTNFSMSHCRSAPG